MSHSFSTFLPFSTIPLGDSGASTPLVPQRYPVSINGHPYMVDWQRYQRQTLETQRPAFDNQAEPGEQTLNPVGFWRRSQSRFDLGAGQTFFDDEQSDVFPTRRFASTRQRYFTSKGINPWRDNGVELHLDTELMDGTAETNLYMLDTGTYLYYVDGDVLRWTDGTTPGSATLPADATGITSDGTYIYVAYGAPQDADKLVIGSATIAAFGTLNPDDLWYANGRMIASESGTLWQYDNAGAHSGSALVLPDFGGTWVDVVGTPVGIFAAINVGTYRGEIYVIDVDETTGGLNPGRIAARLPDGEVFKCLYFYGGMILAGTNLGIRAFVLSGQGGLVAEMQSLIEIPGGVTAMAGRGEYVWFSWSNYDSTSTGLGRMNVARSTDPDAIIPPYASDIMATTQGTIVGVAVSDAYDGRPVFSVSGVGIYIEDATGDLVASGTIDSGWVRFGTLAEKSYLGVEIGHEPLTGSISAALLTFDGDLREAGVSDGENTTFSEILGPSLKTRAVRVQLTLNRDATTTSDGPVLSWWTLLAYPAPPRAQEIILPILLHDKVLTLDDTKQRCDVLSEVEHLEGLARDGTVVAYQQFDRNEQVIVTQIVEDSDETREIPGRGGRTTRRYQNGTYMVRLLTKES